MDRLLLNEAIHRLQRRVGAPQHTSAEVRPQELNAPGGGTLGVLSDTSAQQVQPQQASVLEVVWG